MFYEKNSIVMVSESTMGNAEFDIGAIILSLASVDSVTAYI